MTDINTVTVSGRLTRDCELKFLPSGAALVVFSIASNKSVKVGEKWEEKANFFDCTMFGKQAEAVQKFLLKGKQVFLSGSIDHQQWEKDGQKRSAVKIIVESILLGGGGDKSEKPKGEDLPDDEIPF